MKTLAIFGAPRSGTSWLGQLFNSSPHVIYRFQPLFSYAFKGRLTAHSSREEINKFYVDLSYTKDNFVTQKVNVSGNPGIKFSKYKPNLLVWKEVRYHHIIDNLLKNSETKIIGVVRHPCSVIYSWFRAPKEFNSEWKISEEWLNAQKKNAGRTEEYNGYAKWKELAFQYLHLRNAYPSKFIIVIYERLVENPKHELKKLFTFCNLSWSLQTENFIKESTNTACEDPYGVMRINQDTNSWKSGLQKEIQEAILSDPEFVKLNKFYCWGKN